MKNIINNRHVLWRDGFPRKKGDIHKYDFGLALIYGAPKLTGASRLAAECCARAGCGLVSVLAGETEAPIYKSSLPPHIMVQDDISYFHEKCSARLVGCGGLPRGLTLADLASSIDSVLVGVAGLVVLFLDLVFLSLAVSNCLSCLILSLSFSLLITSLALFNASSI